MTAGGTDTPLPLAPDDHQAFLGQKYPIVVAKATFNGMPPVGDSATIDWGDGSALDTQANVIVFPSFLYIADDHNYAAAGTYTAHVTLKDANGGISTVDDTIQVVAPPIGQFQGNNVSATAGVSFGPTTLATFTADHVFGLPGDHFEAEIDWGDGTIPENGTQGTVVVLSTDPTSGTTTYAVLGSHTYAKPGSYSIRITLNEVELQEPPITANVTAASPGGSTTGTDPGGSITGTAAPQVGPTLIGPVTPSAVVPVFSPPTGSAVSGHDALGISSKVASHLPSHGSEGEFGRRLALSPKTHLGLRSGFSRLVASPLSLEHRSVPRHGKI